MPAELNWTAVARTVLDNTVMFEGSLRPTYSRSWALVEVNSTTKGNCESLSVDVVVRLSSPLQPHNRS